MELWLACLLCTVLEILCLEARFAKLRKEDTSRIEYFESEMDLGDQSKSNCLKRIGSLAILQNLSAYGTSVTRESLRHPMIDARS